MSDRFVRLKSPLLRAREGRIDPATPGILRRRRIAIAVLVALGAALVFLIRSNRLPSPALDVLYVLHDAIALPVWGYSWTRFAPYALTWWSLAGIALVVWLATFLTRRSAVRALHARLCRIVVLHAVARSNGWSRHVARLTTWVDWLAARGLAAELLKDVVRLEQTAALMAIVDGSTLDDDAARQLVRLTDLLAKLSSHAGAPARERWRSLALWHQALMWIDRRAGAASPTAGVAALFAALAATGRTLLERLDAGKGVAEDALSTGLRRDLGWLVEYASAAALRASARPAFGAADRSFMRSVLERLDELWTLAEYGHLDEGASALTTNAPDGVIEAQGVLVASIGLHVASWDDDAHLAESHIRAFEALGFVGYLGVAAREGHRVARALTAQAPERDHYRFVADIVARGRPARATAPIVGRALLDEASRYERMRLDGLHDAAGHGFGGFPSKAAGPAPRAGSREQSSRRSPPRDGPLSELQWRIRYRPLALKLRVDPVLLGGLAATAIVYCTAAALVVLLAFGAGDMAGWSARALPDRRLLENVRRNLDSNPYLDAVFHAADRQLVVSQRGGVLHSYDPATGLWSTARPFGPNDLVEPDIRLLASAGEESGALWGVTAGGGLVRRLNGRWEVVVGDTKFLGRRGTPIQQDGLTAVAASADGKWLLAAAGADGVGLQDIERRRWLARDELPPDDSSAAVTHAVWWRDRFYIGGPDGVRELSVDRRPLAWRPVEGLGGTVVALEATPAEGLFVHQTVPCETGPATCARLARVTDPRAAPSVLIDERNRYAELSLERLFYAVQWQDHLLLAGSSGVFDYDARLHAWKKHAAETISAVGQCAAPSSCFYYGYGGRAPGVALFTSSTMTGEEPRRWPLAGELPTRIAADAPGAAAVLTAAGRAYALGPGTAATLINPAASSPVPLDRYRDAVTFGDKVLFFGQPGALIHDVVRRSYSPLRAVPDWLRSPASIVAASGSFLFGLERRGTAYDVHVVPQQQVELGTLVFNTATPFRIDGPVRGVDTSGAGVLRLIDGSGRVQSIAPTGVTPLTGGRSSAMADARLLDVAGTTDVLGAATSGGVRLYSMRTRSWSDRLPAPAGERVVEIAARAGAWLGRSDATRLVTVGANPSILIGGGDPMPRRPPTDALQTGLDIYLSWPGTIQRYDWRSRQVAATWRFDAAEPVRLAGVVESVPLSVAGGVARAGEREIARGVTDLFATGSHVWLTREDAGGRYLEARPLESLRPDSATPASTPSCLFRTPGAGAGTADLRDARRLSDGVVAVTTNAGLKLHSRDRHSWYGVNGLLPGTGRDTLAAVGSALLVWDPSAGNADSGASSGTLQIVRAPAAIPDSCSTAAARVDATERITARAVAMDERGGAAYVVKSDGSVHRADETATRTMIGGESQGPPETEIVRSWHFPDTAPSVLWVATERSLWQYDLERHQWLERTLEFPSAVRRSERVSIDLESSAGQIALFATIGADTFRGTVANGPGRQPSIALGRSGPRPGGNSGVQAAVFQIGAVTFFHEVSQGRLAVIQQQDGRSTVAYEHRAFRWDRGRRGVAIGIEGPLLLTDAGVHPAGSLASFDPGPAGAPSPSDRLTSGPDLVPRMRRGNRWYRRLAAGVWEPAPQPPTDAVLAIDDGLVWRRRSGSIVVESVLGERVPMAAGARGAELSIDRLTGAAPYGTGIAFLTAAFVELAVPHPSTPVASRGALFPAPPPTSGDNPAGRGDALESAAINGYEVLWLTRSGSAFRWHDDRRMFEPAATANPFARRTLAEIGPLRLTRVGSAIEGELRIADVRGRLRTMPIDLSSGRFPFDVVRSIAVAGSALYVGTDAGLQVYDDTDLALDRARLISLAADTTAARAAIDRVGESCDAPGTVVACGPRGCARQTGTVFADAPADALSCRLRARSPFWSWQADVSGVTGRYAITPVAGAASDAAAPAIALANGQLPHDDVGQVISSGSNTFTVWGDRFVGVHTAGLTLAGASTHAFASPVQLVNTAAPIPTGSADGRDLAPGLYAIERPTVAGSSPGPPRAWRFQNQGWTLVSDVADATTIAATANDPPLLQRRRLRLVRQAGGAAPVFEMRQTTGDWMPLAWDASVNRYALDVWQSIAVHQKALWIATPAGLVSLDGNWSFNPDTFRLVPGPPDEARRTATDLRVDAGGADVRYDGVRAYRVAIDGSAPRPAVPLERDPFAEQTFDVDASYWDWRITERTGVSAGRLTGTWQGEPIAIVNGRFDFDAVNSMSVFQGLLHVATNTRGWFTMPVDSAALDGLSRPRHASIAPLEVARLHGNRDDDDPELCLEGADGQFARLSPGGATRRTQGCPVLAARTGFWRYTRDGTTLRVLAAAGAARPGERRLVDGRFTDDVIAGAPVSGMRNGRLIALVPTAAGLMWWDAARQVVDMHAPPFQAKPDVPRLLHWPAGDSPAYLSDGTLYPIDNDDRPRGSWTVRLPAKAVFERIGSGPGPLITIDWSADGRRHQTLVDPRNGSISHDDIAIDARRIPAYFQRAMTEQSHDGLIRLRLRDGVVSAYATGEGWPIVEADDSFQLLAGVSYGTRAILVGPHHLVELNMDLIARAVFSGRSPPKPTGSERPR
ncbi:MAG TPA: hypothetical protein VFO19_10760 [Vicinamibacterales bacterium]|nr:hypothetical protein [Vicinamibacterales bacterium]